MKFNHPKFFPLVVLSAALFAPTSLSAAPDRTGLHKILSRAVTHGGLLDSHSDTPTTCLHDDIRMLKEIGASFAGRAAYVWELPENEEAHFQKVSESAKTVHEELPDLILQACVFEFISTDITRIPVPAWVFQGFDLPIEKRNFIYEGMLYDDGKYVDHWRPGASVPNLAKLEAQLYFYYRACRYIEAGAEAIHFGQVKLMDDADPDHETWASLLDKVRAFAKKHARRGFVLCDAHTHGEKHGDKLLFDFHSYPLRLREVKGQPEQTILASDQEGDIVGRSAGGLHPLGWETPSAPYLLELDNYGYSGKGGQSVGGIWVWGYDEISWFAHQSYAYQAEWLKMTYNWVNENAPGGYLQMPCRRLLAAPLHGQYIFAANQRSAACPQGLGTEEIILEIWSGAEK